MAKTKRRRPKARWTTLRLGEITLAMSLAMATGVGVGLAALAIDLRWFWPSPVELGTVAGARVLLGSVIGGLITVAVFGLWMRTVVVGMMASHFSPRTLMVFLDDRFQRNLLAFMSAGVVAVLVILLRMPSDEQVAAPLISTVLAVVIALASMAGVLLAIQHATRSLSLPELVSGLTDDAIKVLDRHPKARIELPEVPMPESTSRTVLAKGTGWVTAINIDRMRKALPPGGIVHLRCRVGGFVTPRHTVALVSLVEAGGKTDNEADLDAIAGAVNLARTRSPDKDISFAVSQLVDVGTFALQERWDTATAHEVMVHLGAVLSEIVDRGLPRLHDNDKDGRRVYDNAGWDASDLVQLCVERMRNPAARDPEVSRHLIQMLQEVRAVAVEREDLAVVSEVDFQMEMVLALAEANGMLARDRERLEQEAERFFK